MGDAPLAALETRLRHIARAMPELPEVETTVRGLARVLEGPADRARRGAAAGPAPGASRRIWASG